MSKAMCSVSVANSIPSPSSFVRLRAEGGREGEVTGRTQGGTEGPTKKQTAAAAVDDHIAAYIHYPNTFSIVVGITPRTRFSLHP